MITQTLANIAIASILALSSFTPTSSTQNTVELASQEINLAERTPGGGYMSDIMADNILLNLAYLNDEVADPKNINWDEVRKSRIIEFKLEPGKVFTFHEDYFLKYDGLVTKTTNARFNFEQGFKHDGYLMGDGVCHLASLINWVAKDAGLKTEVPANHDFMPIPGIAREHGVAVYFMPGSKDANARQNLYITNTKDSTVIFKFVIDGKNLTAKLLR